MPLKSRPKGGFLNCLSEASNPWLLLAKRATPRPGKVADIHIISFHPSSSTKSLLIALLTPQIDQIRHLTGLSSLYHCIRSGAPNRATTVTPPHPGLNRQATLATPTDHLHYKQYTMEQGWPALRDALPTPCRYFLAGNCLRGARCQFSHDRPVGERAATPARNGGPRQACKFFARGMCMKRDACPFSHDPNVDVLKIRCKHFARGSCLAGNTCPRFHDPDMVRVRDTEAVQDSVLEDCGIKVCKIETIQCNKHSLPSG